MFVANLDFDTERGANVAALHDAATDPNVLGEIDGPHRIVEGAAARIADEGMFGLAIVIIRAQLFKVVNVFELTIAVGSFARESPISSRCTRGARGKTNDGRRDILAGNCIADEEIGRRPRLGQIGELGDNRVRLVRVREGSEWVGRRRNFDLRSRFCADGFGGTGMDKPLNGQKEDNAENGGAHDEGEKRIRARRAGRRMSNAWNLRHVRFEARG